MGGAPSAEEGALAATKHGADRLAERGFTAADVALTRTGETFQQANGALAYMRQISTGRYNVLVDGNRGIVTALKNIPTGAVARLASNYGWEWIP